MSIKNLFKNNTQVLNQKPEEVLSEVESKQFIKQKIQEIEEFIPNIDFSEPKNFAKFGLAEQYYEKAIEHVYRTYPFDGSEREITNWKNNLSYLEKFVFENEYPKTNGYINLNFDSYTSPTTITGSGLAILSSSLTQYVKTFGGPNSSEGDYKKGNVYDALNNQVSNLQIDPNNGNTVEFWLKLQNGLTNTILSSSLAIFDIWNDVTDTSSSNYTRLLIDLSPSQQKFSVTYRSGVNGVQREDFAYSLANLTSWHHYAFSIKNNNSSLNIKFYVDGKLIEEKNVGTSISSNVNNVSLISNIGSYRYTPLDTEAVFNTIRNIGGIPASIDEFRFWKIEKTQKDISRYRFDRVYGGTNKELSNINLGVYYRFNEGILDSSSVDTQDSIVLDYAGRLSNGSLINYRVNTRTTGSAIDESGLFDSLEIKEPIVYLQHPEVLTKLQELKVKGSKWDEENGNSLYRSLPEWITTEDTEKNTEDLKFLTQIISSYFDKLYLQIKELPKQQFAEYYEDGRKPLPFISSILESNGLEANDLFIESEIIESLKDRDEVRIFVDKLQDLKGLIYKNIHNNLTYLYKTKGTEKSFRNLIRCFGIDEELIKLNIYANNTKFFLSENRKYTTLRKKVIDLSTPDTFASNIFNTYETDDGSQGFSFVPPTLNSSLSPVPFYLVPTTFETELIFPKKLPSWDNNYKTPEDLELSLFGAYTVANTASLDDYTVGTALTNYNFEAFFVKNKKEDRGGYFKFNCLINGETLTSSYFSDVYEGEKWNFAVRIKNPYSSLDVLTNNLSALDIVPPTGSFQVEFYGVNVVENNIKNEFLLTSSALTLPQIKNLNDSPKRFYLGARRNNFTGSALNNTDIMVSSARFWYDYLTNEEIKNHAKDSLNYGILNPIQKPYENLGEKIERMNLLAFNWDFEQVSGSDSNGEVLIKDSKGAKETYDSVFSFNVSKQYPAKISNTLADNKEIVKKYYNLISKPSLPENIFSSDTINIFGESDYAFTRDTKPISIFLSFEKSMYQTISEEMLNVFAGIVDFNNLIGDPVNRYKIEYRGLNAIRSKFFHKIENSPNLERYLEYYKWIDSSIGDFLNQLVPAGSDFSKNIRNMVESHVLERPKYDWKIPQLKKEEITYGQIKGIKELKYNWKKGHAPEDLSQINTDEVQSNNSLWLKERAERQDSNIFEQAGQGADLNKQKILDSSINETNKTAYRVFDTSKSIVYNRTAYYDRRLARVVDILGNNIEAKTDNINVYSVKNVLATTSSFIEKRELFSNESRDSLFDKSTSNYSKKYQIINIPGREINNKYFVKINGVLQSASSSNFIQGLKEFILPERKRYEGIFVNRFSSPGGLETNGRGQLDRESETFSVYNGINNRNLLVRKTYNSWLQETSSINNNFPSYHKINKNRVKRAEREQKDNGFIVRQIPRTDYGYSWITASTTEAITSSGPYSSIYPNINLENSSFLSASLKNGQIIDYVGINKDIDLNVDEENSTLSFTNENSSSLNKFLLKENGPYGYNSWKQTRGKDKKITNRLNKNNKFIVQKNIVKLKTFFQPFDDRLRFQVSSVISISPLVEPPVEWNMPMVLGFGMNSSFNEVENILKTSVKTDFSNNLDTIANAELKQFINPPIKNIDDLAYSKIKNLLFSKISDPDEPRFLNVSVSEVIYPRKDKIGLGEIRTKPEYAENAGTGSNGYDRNAGRIRSIWKNNLQDRFLTNPYSSSDGFGAITTANAIYRKPSSPKTPENNPYEFNFGILLSSYNYDNNINPLSTAFISRSIELDDINKTFFPLENQISYSISTGSFFTGSSTGSITFITQSIRTFGELTPFSEHENYLSLLRPAGNYVSGNFSYTNNRYKFIPRPQFAFTNHKPQYFYTGSNKGTDTAQLYDAYVNLAVNDGFTYKTAELSNNAPWYDSYEDYLADIKPRSQNYSIVPEFVMSRHMSYYLKEKGGDFSQPITGNYLSLDGANIEINDISKGYNSSDVFNKFIYKDFDTKQRRIKIKFNTINKLLPYKGFYPQNRTEQIVDLFCDSFFGLSTEQMESVPLHAHSLVSASGDLGTPIYQQIQTVLQPFFAPGILFNTIKSSIAVDWATFITNSADYAESFRPNFYTGSSTAPNNSSFLKSYALGGVPSFNHRFSFESLLDIENSIPINLKNSALYYLNPTYYSMDVDFNNGLLNLVPYALAASASIKNPLYKILDSGSDYNPDWKLKNTTYTSAINNFLAEIPNFFLKNGELNKFQSTIKPNTALDNSISTGLSVVSGTTYFMDVYLQKNTNYKAILDKEYDRIIGLTGSRISTDPNTDQLFSYQLPASKMIIENEFFGPPSYYTSSSSDYINPAEITVRSPQAYAPYTPPYMLGKSIARLSYKADNTSITSYEDILKKITIEYINNGLDNENTFATNNIMTLSASVNLKQKSNISNTWVIQTKFETPSLNFNNVLNNSANTTGSDIIPLKVFPAGSSSFGIQIIEHFGGWNFYSLKTLGLWTGYGEPPNSKEGIIFGIEDTYSPLQRASNTGSLIELCGFEPGIKDVGQIAEAKQISEGVILIPLVEKGYENFDEANGNAVNINGIIGENGITEFTTQEGPFYFKINKTIISSILGIDFNKATLEQIKDNVLNSLNDDNSIIKIMKGMLLYNLPPQLDWIRNRSIEPFVMYFADFNATLDKQDLSDIWQGLMPKPAKTVQLQNKIFEHALEENEFFHGKNLPENIKFKVFKVKKRANTNYYSLIEGAANNEEALFSYNYPYDFFSLIEMIKIDATAKAGTEDESESQPLPIIRV